MHLKQKETQKEAQKEETFVKKNKMNDLIESIKEKELQLTKLRLYINKSTVCSDLYNKVVLEKAILKKELQDLSKPDNLLSKMKKHLPHKKVLICDYFKK